MFFNRRRSRRRSSTEELSFGPRSASFRNPEREVHFFRIRILVAIAFVLLAFIGLIGRFSWLQVVKYEEYHAQAEQNKRESALRSIDFIIGAVLLLLPVALIIKQPDLGTAMLVLAAGFFVIFFAGLPWKWLVAMFAAGLAMLPVAWTLMHDYQRQRIMTLIDPTTDPLGKGFHTIQAMIAIGSGGTLGKGWMQGTQAHLEFIPERTTDFIFAVFSEEFGLVGNVVLVTLFFALVWRALTIAMNAPTVFARLLAAALRPIYRAESATAATSPADRFVPTPPTTQTLHPVDR